MIAIDRKKVAVPKVFSSKEMEMARKGLEKYYRASRKGQSQKRFSRPFEAELRKPILEALLVLFNNKCAYCETIIRGNNTNAYDHFRPKFGARGLDNEFSNFHYWWLTYEWSNFYLACQKCGRFKSTWFPVDGKRGEIGREYSQLVSSERPILIDPCNDDPAQHLKFLTSGSVDFVTKRGKATIDLLNLNRTELINARAKIADDTTEKWEGFIKLYSQKDSHWKRIQQICREWERVFDGSSDLSHLAVIRSVLQEKFRSNKELSNFFQEKKYELTLETRVFSNISEITAIIETEPIKITSQEKKQIEREIASDTFNRVFLESIELKNYKCFEHLVLKFDNDVTNYNSEEAGDLGQPWYLFLGENGVGKSSILKAIAIALTDANYHKGLKEISADELLRDKAKRGFIKLCFSDGRYSLVEFASGERIKTNIKKRLTNVLGYGAVRVPPKNGIQPEQVSYKGIRIKNLFDYSVSLIESDQWLMSIEDEMFNEKTAPALKQIMLLNDDDVLFIDRKNKCVKVKFANGSTLPVSVFSDGYRSLYALAVDIMSSLSFENASYELAEGIVLVDELGTHLHPRWKMIVVERLRKTFRKLQFIVSTHEPLCLRGLVRGEAIVLTRDEDGDTIAISDLPDPSELRIDQILTSEYFGLKSTYDQKTEDLFDEYYAILAKDDQTRTADEKARLHVLSNQVPKIKHLGNDLREELAYFVIDELLAKEGRKQKIDREKLKDSALKKIRNIWKTTIDSKND